MTDEEHNLSQIMLAAIRFMYAEEITALARRISELGHRELGRLLQEIAEAKMAISTGDGLDQGRRSA